MYKLKTTETTIEVEFRHSREASWTRRFGIRAVTTAVARVEVGIRPACTIIETVICSPEDNFSRAEGRRRSLLKVIARAKMVSAEEREKLTTLAQIACGMYMVTDESGVVKWERR